MDLNEEVNDLNYHVSNHQEVYTIVLMFSSDFDDFWSYNKFLSL